MLSGLFKPAWQSQSAEKRISAIEKMDMQDAESESVLTGLVSDDPERDVQEAALNRLAKPSSLFEIGQTHPDASIREKSNTIFSRMIGAKSALTEGEFRALVTDYPDSASYVAKLCPISSLRSHLLKDKPEAELVEILSDLEYSETRYQIAEQLSSSEHLETARKLLQGKDKNAEKLIRSKLDVIRKQQKQDEENNQTAEGLCEKMEYLASQADKEWRSEFNRRYLATTSLWEALDFEPEPSLVARYDEAKLIAQPLVEKQKAIENTHRAQEALLSNLDSCCEDISKLSLDQISENITDLEAKHENFVAEWTQLSGITFPKLTLTDKFFSAQQALANVISLVKEASVQAKKADSSVDSNENESINTGERFSYKQIATLKSSLKSLRWPNAYPDLRAEDELSSIVREQETELNRAEKAKRDQLDKLHKRINRLLGSTNRGELGRAKRELAAVTKASENYEGKDRAALDDRLEKAAESLNKMGDWKDFATEPKYLELCEAMEALADSKTHPDALSKEIHALQQSWKSLGHSDSADEHWERFKAAGDKAYEPCALFFKERRDDRQRNLEEREVFVERARTLLDDTDWEAQPDYKAVESELRRFTNDWKKIKDVEQGAGQKQWNRFSKIKNALYEKLDVAYDANIALKHQLVEQARALVEADVKDESLNRLQQLQLRWKQVGITRRKEDQNAWADFKKATDEVYAKIQGVRQSKRDEENAQLEGFRKISRQIQELAKTASDLAEADHRFEQLQEEYQALPALPKGLPEKLVDGLAEDYRRACDAFSRARDRILQAGRAKELDALAEKARLCAELEKLANTGAPKEELDRLEADINDIQISDRDLNQRFSQRLSSALDTDRAHASDARRMLLIDLEILLGVESPDEDRELRMKVQLERMTKQGIGRGQPEKETVLSDLKLDWLCLPGAEPNVQSTLNQRFSQLVLKA